MNKTMVDISTSPVGGVRRRGNVMLFVIFILGTLFAASMAFLALMRTEAGVMTSRSNQGKLDVIFGGLSDDLLLGVADSLMGRGVILTGPDLDPCLGNDEVLAGRIPYVEAFRDCDGPDGDPTIPDPDGLADNPDMLAPYAMIPGVHPLLSSHEPYSSGVTNTFSLNLEYFAATDLSRAWDGHADVHTGTGGLIQPTLPAGHPLRIRALDEGDPGDAGPFTYSYDQTDDARETFHGSLADADGDGVVDSYRYRIARLGDGDTDWFNPDPGALGDDGTAAGPDDYSPLDTDDGGQSGGNLCDGIIDTLPPPNGLYKGAPSFTDGPPTPLPCDDFDRNGILDFGTAYPQHLRRAIAAKLRDQDENIVDDVDDLYFSARVIQNGGMANLGKSHRTLIDNLFGLADDGTPDGTPVAYQMDSLPYGPAVEQALRRRGVLGPLGSNDPLTVLGPLGEDMLNCDPGAPCGRQGWLYKTLLGALFIDQGDPLGQLQWFPVLDEPGPILAPDGNFDLDWADRWMDPDGWNDLRNSANVPNFVGERDYDISHLLTNFSIDDLLMRNGFYNFGGSAAVLLNDLTNSALPIPASYNPSNDGMPATWGSGDSALMMYPGYDPSYPAAAPSDPSFYDRGQGGTGLAKLPLALVTPNDGLSSLYEPPRDANGNIIDPRFGKMQFALHSIGDINNPTQREKDTVQDYFTVMLRNVWALGPMGPDGVSGTPDDNLGPDGVPGTPDDEDLIHDQAAQLTANFIDFADYDSGAASPPVTPVPGGMEDYPTEVVSRSGTIYYGVEDQPYISEVWHNGENYALALVNPHPHLLPDLVALGYSIRIKKLDGTFPLFDLAPGELPSGEEYYYAATTPIANAAVGKDREIPGLAFAPNDTIQLIRKVPSSANPTVADIVVDEFVVPVASDPQSAQRGPGWLSPVPVPFATDADYAAYIQTHTLGSTNSAPSNLPPVLYPAPVHATGDHFGLESAYPTTGSMLLLMRHACKDNLTNNSAGASAFTASLRANRGKVDNGHMPVFDQTQLAQANWNGTPGAQPMDGTTLLSIPWGQLVFDYFTALPFENQFDPLVNPPRFTIPTNPGDMGDLAADPNIDGDGDGIPAGMDRGYAAYVAYLRANQPTVELGGVRVHGRININAAPWKVLEGLPLMHPQVMPIYKHVYWDSSGALLDEWRWRTVLRDPTQNANPFYPMGTDSFTSTGVAGSGPPIEQLGVEKARGIVAYRELREIQNPGSPWPTGNYNTLDTVNPGLRMRSDGSANFLANTTQRHTAGFLTVGELANVRFPKPGSTTGVVTDALSQMDNGQTHNYRGAGAKNYLYAVAPLVALGDWVTVKGHTFTAYGVLTGHGKVQSNNPDDDVVLDRAERFEMVFDRSNLLISDDPAERPEVIYKVREPLSEVNPN